MNKKIIEIKYFLLPGVVSAIMHTAGQQYSGTLLIQSTIGHKIWQEYCIIGVL